jgi:hypothetical protein
MRNENQSKKKMEIDVLGCNDKNSMLDDVMP